MTKAEALARLRSREDDLRKLGITNLAIFGSTARNEARPDSDVDLVASVDYDAVRALGPFNFFGIEGKIEEMLGPKVDFMTEPSRNDRLRVEIDRDRVHVF